VKLAVVVPPSVSTLLERVGVVVTAAVLYTTPFADSEDPLMLWPPEEAVVLVIDVADVVVVIEGITNDIPSLPIAKYAVVPLVGRDCVKPDPAAVNGLEPLTVATAVVQVEGIYNPTFT